MTRPPVCGAGATFGLLMVEKERLRRIGRDDGDESEADERERDLCEIKLQAPHAVVAMLSP